MATPITTRGTGMDNAALYRLMAWLSPSYPVGAFAYSHGIEWAVEDGRVTGEAALAAWAESIVRHGSGWSDAVLFAHAHACAGEVSRLAEVNDFAIALTPSAERHLETTAQGTAFVKATKDAWPWPDMEAGIEALGSKVAYPVAVAMAASAHGIPLAAALNAYLHGFAANLVSAGVRLIPLGQSAGQRVLAGLENAITETAAAAENASFDDVGGIAVTSDIAAMQHETQYTRLFRS
ncbi:MAG: urease accessory protein UreF [Rhodospirillales bacterium]